MDNRFLIIGSAPDTDLRRFCTLAQQGVRVICADGGIAAAQKFGIMPELFIGDLDSGRKPENIPGILLPAEKDYSDLHTAVLWALSHGGKELYLAGCTNGRADHFFANLCLLELIHDNGARGVVSDIQNRIYFNSGGTVSLIRSQSCFAWDDNSAICVPEDFKYVSLLPLDNRLTGITLNGLKYPLNDACLERSIPVGVSNEMTEKQASISVKRGRYLLVLSKDVDC